MGPGYGPPQLQIYGVLCSNCRVEVAVIMNMTDKQLAAEGEKRCVCSINGINRPENVPPDSINGHSLRLFTVVRTALNLPLSHLNGLNAVNFAVIKIL